MNAASDKPRKFACPSCQDTGLIIAPRGMKLSDWDGRFESLPGPVRALPLPCSFCEAGRLELEVENRVDKLRRAHGCTGGEIEIFRFRQAKG